MKTKYPIALNDLTHQPDHITPKKIQLCQEYATDPDNARLLVLLIRRREVELISDGNKLIKFELYKYSYNCINIYFINENIKF